MIRCRSHSRFTPALVVLFGGWVGSLAALPAALASGAGTASDAQPGLHRVALAEATEPALAATLGYGLTEALGAGEGAHHRASLRLAAAASPLPWLNLAPILDARYDVHEGDDGGIVGGALALRPSAAFGSLRLGGEVKAWAPGSESAGTSFEALSLDLRALFGAELERTTLGLIAGYRLDRSAEAGTLAPRLSESDRAALGLSEFDALLLGFGASFRLGRTELWGEASGDLLVGEGAPSVAESPLRVAAGVRQALSKRWTAELSAEAALSERPGIAPSEPLIPIEPRISALVGIRYRFTRDATRPSAIPARSPGTQPAARSPATQPAARSPATQPAPAPPTDTVLQVTLLDEEGEPISEAELSLSIAGTARELAATEDGRFRGEHVPPGSAELAVDAAGFEPERRSVKLEAGVPLELVIRMKALPPPSQVRGVVRTFGGKGLAARVSIAPLGVQTETDASGAFQIDVPPGRYEVSIEAEGYELQRRTVVVDPQGVVIVNADLVKKR